VTSSITSPAGRERTGAPRPFRFGVVAAQARSGEEWAATARRAEELGFSTLLIPDTVGPTLSPLTALAYAAASTVRLRLGTYVLAADYRNPVLVARDTATLDLLSGGRVELGLGAGRPNAQADYARLGLSFDGGGVRVDRLAAALATIREQLEGDAYPRPVQRPRPPILVAASGRRMLSLAAEQADIIAIAARPDEPESAVAERIARVREAAADRAGDLELNLNLAAVGTELDPGARAHLGGVDLEELARLGSPAVLLGSLDHMCEELTRRREVLGVSYVCASASQMAAFAPVVERLTGR
jgi:probable F420-dependent oxidoreductase